MIRPSWLNFEEFKQRYFVDGRIPEGNEVYLPVSDDLLRKEMMRYLQSKLPKNRNIGVRQHAHWASEQAADLFKDNSDVRLMFIQGFHNHVIELLDKDIPLQYMFEYEFMTLADTTFTSTKEFNKALVEQIFVRRVIRIHVICKSNESLRECLERDKTAFDEIDYALCCRYMVINKMKTGAYSQTTFAKCSLENAPSAPMPATTTTTTKPKNKTRRPKAEAQMADIPKAPVFTTTKRDNTIESERPKDNTRYCAFVQVGKDEYQYVIDTIDNINEYAEHIVFKDTSGIPVREFKQKTIALIIKRKRLTLIAKWSKNTFHFKPNEHMSMDDIIDIIQSPNE